MENIFKSKLENYSELPPQAVWNRIQHKRTPLYIWWNAFKLRGWKYAASVVLLMVSAITVYYTNYNKDKGQLLNQSNHSVQNEIAVGDNKSASNANADLSENKSNEGIKGAFKSDDLNANKLNSKPNNNSLKHKNSNKRVKSTSNQVENKTIKEQTQKDAFDRLYISKIEMGVFVAAKTFEFYPDLLPYSFLSKSVIKIIEPERQNKSQGTSKWYAEMSAGPMMASRKLTGDAAIKALRDQSENARMGWNINAKFGRNIGMHWEIESGLQWMQRREALIYNYDYNTIEKRLISTDVKIYHPNLDPTTVRVVDTVYQMQSASFNRNHTNTYTALSIPLIARYNYYFPKALSVNAAIGLLTDVYSTNKGEILANAKESVAINSVTKSNQLNQRLLMSAGIKYKTSKHWSILAEPVAVFGIYNTMIPDYSIKQKEFGFMINTGLRYNF